MYRFQLKFQKIVCILSLIACVVAFVYGLGFSSDLYKVLFPGTQDQAHPEFDYFSGANLYYQAQPINNFLVVGALVVLIICLFLFITQTNSRRKYYITNYIATGATSLSFIVFSIMSIVKILSFRARFLNEVDWDMLETLQSVAPTVYIADKSTFIFDLGVIIFLLLILVAIVLIANMILKILLMNGEKKLLRESGEINNG